MKNLFLGLITTLMFGFSTNATNSVTTKSFNNSLSIEKFVLTTRTINATDLIEDDGCRWVTFKTTRVYYADGSVGRIVHQKWVCD